MAEKDITERYLLNLDDVFADVVNGCLALTLGDHSFRRVAPEELREALTRTFYAADGEIRDQERDVARYWTVGGAVFCLVGLENQTDVDPDMALRVLGYAGGDYRRQLAHKGKERYPVLTFVLYFGTERRWPEYLKSLLGRVKCAEFLRPLLNDWRIHVIEVAFLTDEQADCFHGDFRFVVEVLLNIQRRRDFVPSDRMIRHVDAVLQFLAALTGERRLENLPNIKRGQAMTVRNIFAESWDKIRKEGIVQGREEGRVEGRAEGRVEGRAEGRVEGRAEGRVEGRAEGFLHALVSLVNDGLLPLAAAAARAGMSEAEFSARMREGEARQA